MGLLADTSDPTTALFLSRQAAQQAGDAVLRKYPERVSKCLPKPRTSRGQSLGYALIVHFTDNRHPTPLTNSDFERVVGA